MAKAAWWSMTNAPFRLFVDETAPKGPKRSLGSLICSVRERQQQWSCNSQELKAVQQTLVRTRHGRFTTKSQRQSVLRMSHGSNLKDQLPMKKSNSWSTHIFLVNQFVATTSVASRSQTLKSNMVIVRQQTFVQSQ